jgi:phage terminase large subunit-like protein
MDDKLYPHVAAATRYAEAIVSGEIPACHWVRRCCQRQLDDLGRQGDPTFPFHFDPEVAERICRFAELLPHIKGEWAGQRIELHPSQSFELTTIFGWLQNGDGLRRYRKAYLKKPRKNAKSTETAIVGLFMAFADHEPGAEVYSGATKLDQAMEVFRPAWLMVKRTPDLQKRFSLELFGTKDNPGPITSSATGSRFAAVVGKPGDGASPHCGITDEYHEHATSEQVDTFETGMGARRQPLSWVITTAGTNLAGPCYELEKRCQKILDGSLEDQRQFCIMYDIDEGDDVTDFKTWAKANPMLGVSLKEDFLRAQQREALTSATRQNILYTKHLNVWCNARTAWMNMAWWDKCEDLQLKPADVADYPLYVGLDGASKIDLASRVMLFTALLPVAPNEPEDDIEAAPVDGDEDSPKPLAPPPPPRGFKRHYWIFGKHYAPASQAHDPKNTHYSGWEKEGRLEVTQGDEIDIDRIEQDIREDICGRYELVELDYDPWRLTQLAQDLAKEGVTTVEVRPLVNYFSPAMKEVLAAAKAGRLHHDGDPVLRWMVSNVVARADNKGEVFPCKEHKDSALKIDGAIATFMAVYRAMCGVAETSSGYEDYYRSADKSATASADEPVPEGDFVEPVGLDPSGYGSYYDD